MICDNNFLNNQLCGEMSMTNGYSEKVLYVISLKIVGHFNTILSKLQVKTFLTHLIVYSFQSNTQCQQVLMQFFFFLSAELAILSKWWTTFRILSRYEKLNKNVSIWAYMKNILMGIRTKIT